MPSNRLGVLDCVSKSTDLFYFLFLRLFFFAHIFSLFMFLFIDLTVFLVFFFDSLKILLMTIIIVNINVRVLLSHLVFCSSWCWFFLLLRCITRFQHSASFITECVCVCVCMYQSCNFGCHFIQLLLKSIQFHMWVDVCALYLYALKSSFEVDFMPNTVFFRYFASSFSMAIRNMLTVQKFVKIPCIRHSPADPIRSFHLACCVIFSIYLVSMCDKMHIPLFHHDDCSLCVHRFYCGANFTHLESKYWTYWMLSSRNRWGCTVGNIQK